MASLDEHDFQAAFTAWLLGRASDAQLQRQLAGTSPTDPRDPSPAAGPPDLPSNVTFML